MADNDHHGMPPLDPRIAAAACEGCAESRLLMSRRAMLGVTAGLFTSAFLPDFANAATDPEARFLVVVLRGGLDGIGMVIPKLDSHYASMRKNLALPFSQTLSLGADFALHPALARVHQMYWDGDAAIVPAAGLPLRNRSHFECQDNLENGLPSNTSNSTGWINRLLGALPAGDPIRRHRGIQIGDAPLITRGPEPMLGWSPTWFTKASPDNIARLEAAYTALDPDLWDSLKRGLEADALALKAGASDTSGLSVLRKAFIGAGRLLRAKAGPRIAVLSIGDFDTHSQQGGLTGYFNDRLRDLDLAMADLKKELRTAWANTVAICVTEFGRTVRTNGDGGTDHGVGTAVLMVGGAVKGRIVGDWPGIGPAQLYEGVDLKPAVDLRAVFKGILHDHVGVPTSILNSVVFPGSGSLLAEKQIIKRPDTATRSAADFERPLTMQEVAPIALYRQHHGA